MGVFSAFADAYLRLAGSSEEEIGESVAGVYRILRNGGEYTVVRVRSARIVRE